MRLLFGFLALRFAIALFLLSAVACGISNDKTGCPAKKAGATMGRAIDQAVEKARPTVEKAGEQIKEAGGKLKEETSQAIDRLKERVNNNDDKTNDQKH